MSYCCYGNLLCQDNDNNLLTNGCTVFPTFWAYYYLLLTLMATHRSLIKSKTNKKQIKNTVLQIHTYTFWVQLSVRIGQEKLHPCLQLHGPCDWSEVPNEWSCWMNYWKLFLHHLWGNTSLLLDEWTSKISHQLSLFCCHKLKNMSTFKNKTSETISDSVGCNFRPWYRSHIAPHPCRSLLW